MTSKERAISSPLTNNVDHCLAEEQRAIDLALLRQLESKYRAPEGERNEETHLAVPISDETPIMPVQGSLF